MKRILTPIAIIMTSVSCNNSNPFLTEWNTPYGIPDFDAVKEKHYAPAVKAGIEQQQAEPYRKKCKQHEKGSGGNYITLFHFILRFAVCLRGGYL